MFKKYLSRFDVTEKAVKTEEGKTITTKADPSRQAKKRHRLFGWRRR
jgi:hypothetical protein